MKKEDGVVYNIDYKIYETNFNVTTRMNKRKKDVEHQKNKQRNNQTCTRNQQRWKEAECLERGKKNLP